MESPRSSRPRCWTLLPTLAVLVATAAGTPPAAAQELGALVSPGPLSAAHAKLEGLKNCEKCHEPGKKVTAARCLACHQPIAERMAAKKGVHRDVTDDCVTCHVEHAGADAELRPLDPSTFDHSAETGYPLDGRHAAIARDCAKCHTTRSYLTARPECASCHKDVHLGVLGADCARCHGTAAPFASATQTFDHGATPFPLTGAHGTAPPDSYKVSATYRDGYTASGMLTIFGRDAVVKARRCGEIVLERVRNAGFHLERSHIECLGSTDVAPGVLTVGEHLEIVLRVTVADPRQDAVERFTKEFAPLVTSGPQGVTGYATGRPKVRPVFGYWPCLIPRDRVRVTSEIAS